MQDAGAEEFEACSAEHGVLDHLEAADLPFDGTDGPGGYATRPERQRGLAASHLQDGIKAFSLLLREELPEVFVIFW